MKNKQKCPQFSYSYKAIFLILVTNKTKFQSIGILMFPGKVYFLTSFKKLID